MTERSESQRSTTTSTPVWFAQGGPAGHGGAEGEEIADAGRDSLAEGGTSANLLSLGGSGLLDGMLPILNGCAGHGHGIVDGRRRQRWLFGGPWRRKTRMNEVARPKEETASDAGKVGADAAGPDAGPGGAKLPAARRPSFVFFAAVAACCLLADVLSKAWAEVELTRRSPVDPLVLVEHHLNFALAYNRGGAWGLLQNASETLRRPFFLVVSVAAIAFIVSLYGKLMPNQRALRWGLPLVLGGALGNLADRITRGSVVDFIDYRADWVESMNRLIASVVDGWHLTDHWPTFNVADISICIGVGLMAVDMLMSGRRNAERAHERERRVESASHPTV
jgi:signal peptidase II